MTNTREHTCTSVCRDRRTSENRGLHIVHIHALLLLLLLLDSAVPPLDVIQL